MMDVQTQMRLTGLASGLDTDLIIQNLGKAHTVRIDAVKRERQIALWRQESYRGTIAMLQNFTKSSFNAANPTSNFRSASAFAKFSYNLSVGGTASEAAKTAAAKVLSVTANGDLKSFNQSVQAVAQLASKDTWSGKDMGLRGVKSSGFSIENLVQRSPNGVTSVATAYFGLSIDGISRTIQIDPAKINAIVNGTTGSPYNRVDTPNDYAYKPAENLDIDFSNWDDGSSAVQFALNDLIVQNSDGTKKVNAFAIFRDIQNAFEKAAVAAGGTAADGTADALHYFENEVNIDSTGMVTFGSIDPDVLAELGGTGAISGFTKDELEDAVNNGITLREPDYDGIDVNNTYVVGPTSQFISMKQYLANWLGVDVSDFDDAGIDFESHSAAEIAAKLDTQLGDWSGTESDVRAALNRIGSVQRYEVNSDYSSNTNAKAFADLINEEVKKQFGSDYAGLVTVDAKGELVFNKAGSTITLFDSFGGSTQLAPLGFPSGGVSSNFINTKTLGDLFDPDGTFFTEKNSNNEWVSTNRTIQVNGKSIVLSPTDTITAMVTKINNSGAGVNIAYNSASDKFTLTSSQEGSANNVSDLTDAAAQFFSFLGFGQAVAVERDIDRVGSNGYPETVTVDGYRLVTGGKFELASNERIVTASGVITYDSDAGQFKLTDGGVSNFLDNTELKDLTGVDLDNGVGSRVMGTNLIAQINGEVFVRQSNTFLYEGMTYTFTDTYGIDKNSGDPDYKPYNITNVGGNEVITIDRGTNVDDEIKINVGKNTAELIDSIKAFVEEYNSIIDHLNELLNGKRDRDYKPLTDDEKKAMKEDDIKAYEEKAKTGIMANDTELRKLLNEMRSAIYQKVEGVGLTMSEIGIATGANWKEGGRLMIDEDKLQAALENRYDEVVTLFTKADTGIAQRLNKVIHDASRTTTFDVDGKSVGTKGYLIEKAGTVNDASQFNNSIQKQITTYDEKINTLLERWYRQENAYYAMFTRMETAMAKMQSQQNSLASLLAQQGSK